MAATTSLIDEYNQLVKQAAALYADAKAIIAQGSGPGPLYGDVEDRTGKTTVKGSGSIYAEFGLTPPGRLPSQALKDRLSQDLGTLVQIRDRMSVVYTALHPTFDLSPAEFIGILVATVATAGAVSYLAAGAAAAAPAAVAASTPGLTTIGTEAAVATTAGTVGEAGAALSTVGTTAALTSTAGALTEASGALAAAGAPTGAIAAASAASTAGSLAGTLGKGVADLTGSSTLGSLVSGVAGNLGSIFQDIEAVIKPLASFAQETLQGIETLNKTFVQPVADFISKDYTTITGLITEVHTLANSGLKGILAIPDALASAFSGLDAANQRLAQQTGQINSSIAQDVLVPGIGDKVAAPLGDIHALMNEAWSTPIADVGKIESVQLDESLFKDTDLTANFNRATVKLASMGVVGKVVAVLVDSFNDILGYLASVENIVELAKQKGNTDLPVEPLGIEEVIDAWWKDHFDESTALTELLRHGIDETRARALYALKEWLPDANTAVEMFYKGVITSEEVADALTRQGYSQADINALVNNALDPVNPREAITMAGRLAAASAGFLSQSLNSAPSDEIKQLYPPKLTRADVANWDWLAHWNIQPLDWWITCWYRGLCSDDEFKLAAQAANVPDELIPNLTSVAGQTVQLWMIPDMMGKGVFTEAQAREYLKYIGIEPKSVDVLIQYGQLSANAGKGPDLLGLGKISEGNAKQMLEDGIIDGSEYHSILIAHGYTEQAATLQQDLAEQQIELQARRTYASNLIQEFELGELTLQELQSHLGGEGFTQAEVQNYTQQAQTAALKKTKRLTNTDIKEFLGAGIFTEAQALTTLTAIGWSQTYAEAFIELWTRPKAAAPPKNPTA